MARLLCELVRRPSSNRFITTLTSQNPSNLSPLPCLHQHVLYQTKFDHGGSFNPSLMVVEEAAHLSKLQICPSFSFGFFLNPVVQSGWAPSQLVRLEDAPENSGMMWADSVKKKRKKKMNKHKYKKLRKRLRRKTKT